MIKDNIFRAYDIRGIYPNDITNDGVILIGKSFGTYVKQMGVKEVLVGYDNRLSSPKICNNLIHGITSTGINVINLGLITTPMFYYARVLLNNFAGVMITASHNPKEYNGFKISFNQLGNALGDEIIAFRDFTKKQLFASGNGKVHDYNIKNEYINNVVNSLQFGNKKIKTVFDCGNGTGSIVIKDIIDKLPIEPYYLYCESDGTFPNHQPDPAVNKNLVDLCNKVKELHYDLGVAFDADCDRVGVVDNHGNIIDVDILMAIIYQSISSKMNNRTALFDVKCSKALPDVLDKLNIKSIMWRTGNSYINRKFKEEKLDFAGEYAGHLYFADRYIGYDDGIYAGLRIIELLSNTDKTMFDLNETIPKYISTPELFVVTTDNNKFKIVEKLNEYAVKKGYNIITIDGVRIMFNDGWALIRASNTTPRLSIRFEANTQDRLNDIQNEFMEEIKIIIEELGN